jgi:hypothetical protein
VIVVNRDIDDAYRGERKVLELSECSHGDTDYTEVHREMIRHALSLEMACS